MNERLSNADFAILGNLFCRLYELTPRILADDEEVRRYYATIWNEVLFRITQSDLDSNREYREVSKQEDCYAN